MNEGFSSNPRPRSWDDIARERRQNEGGRPPQDRVLSLFKAFVASTLIATPGQGSRDKETPPERPVITGPSTPISGTGNENRLRVPEPSQANTTQEQHIAEAQQKRSQERLENAQAMLRALTNLLQSGKLESDVPMFRRVPETQSAEACAFVDAWYVPQKPRIHRLWEYARKHQADWGEDLTASMNAALEVSRTASGVLNWFIVPRKFWAPTTLKELMHKLDTALAEPAPKSTSCGALFDKGYGYLKERHQIENVQKLFRKLLIGFAKLIEAELVKHGMDERQLDYDAALELVAVTESLLHAHEKKGKW